MNKDYKSINNLWKDSEGYRYFGTLKLSSKIKYDGDDFIPLWEWVEQLQQENQQLKLINKEYERLAKGESRGCVITRVDEYDIYDLIKCKDNWNKLKEWVKMEHREDAIVINLTWKHATGKFLDKMQEIEEMSE